MHVPEPANHAAPIQVPEAGLDAIARGCRSYDDGSWPIGAHRIKSVEKQFDVVLGNQSGDHQRVAVWFELQRLDPSTCQSRFRPAHHMARTPNRPELSPLPDLRNGFRVRNQDIGVAGESVRTGKKHSACHGSPLPTLPLDPVGIESCRYACCSKHGKPEAVGDVEDQRGIELLKRSMNMPCEPERKGRQARRVVSRRPLAPDSVNCPPASTFPAVSTVDSHLIPAIRPIARDIANERLVSTVTAEGTPGYRLWLCVAGLSGSCSCRGAAILALGSVAVILCPSGFVLLAPFPARMSSIRLRRPRRACDYPADPANDAAIKSNR